MWKDIPAPMANALDATIQRLIILQAELQKCAGEKKICLFAAERMFEEAQRVVNS
jgi:hypothetical protein